jgi:hypothetical protein
MILLGKNPGIIQKRMNVDVGGLKEDADATDYMATAGLERAGIVVTIDLEPLHGSNIADNSSESSSTASSETPNVQHNI